MTASSALVIRLPNRRTRQLRMVAATTLFMALVLPVQALVATEPGAFGWTLLAAITTVVTLGYCFRPGLLGSYPFSTVSVMGFNVVMLGIPLVAQSASGTSFLYNLQVPEVTIDWTIRVQIVILLTHVAYVQLPVLNRVSDRVAISVMRKLSAFRIPTNSELWMLGAVGVSATWISRIIFGASIEYGDVGGKFLQSLVFFIAFPFFIPFRGPFSQRRMSVSPMTTGLLILYFLLVVVTAVAANVRVIFSFVGLDVLVALLLMIAMGRLRFSNRAKMGIVIVGLLSLPVVSAFEDLATAMEVTREERGTVSGSDYITRTYAAFQDKAALDRYREFNVDASDSLQYSEAYVRNKFLNRLELLKATDLTMEASSHLSMAQRDVVKQSFRIGLLSILPTPIAKAVGINLDKKQAEFSSGDVYQSLAYGRELGSFLTGSAITEARDVFGPFVLPVLALVYLFVFIALDSLRLRGGGVVILSPISFILLYSIFARGLIDDALWAVIASIVRNVTQNLLAYAIIGGVVRFLSGALKVGGSAPVARARAVG